MRSLTIQIPTPCHEPWDGMQPNDKGRFCASCQKTVVDYTALSDQELVRMLRRIPDSNCGRFRNEQLDRPLPLANQTTSAAWRHWIGLLTLGLFGWQTARAQVKLVSKPVPSVSVRPDIAVASLPARQTVSPPTLVTIEGRVMHKDSSGTLSPLAEVYISISQTDKTWRTQTDSLGVFTISVPAQLQPADLTLQAHALSPFHIPGRTTFTVSPSTCSVALKDIVLTEPETRQPISITGGGLTLVRTPSRWQKLKQKLFR